MTKIFYYYDTGDYKLQKMVNSKLIKTEFRTFLRT